MQKLLSARILGCGGSNGVPEVGCNCFTCNSPDPKNKRLRTSLLIQTQKTKVLIDSSPDLRQQALRHNINKIDAVLYTHSHSDHVNGIDDLKLLCNKPTNAYMDQVTLERLQSQFDYAFTKTPLYAPILKGIPIEPYIPFSIGDIDILPLSQQHHDIQTLAFRFGDIAYSTDFSQLPERTLELLVGVKYWIVGCLRYSWAPSHPYLETVMRYIYKIKPHRAILIHMSHQIECNEIRRLLPHYVIPGYDGMHIT